MMIINYGKVLYKADDATLDDLREAIKTLEDVEPTARRTLGGTHSYVAGIKGDLDASRARLRAREAAGSA